ncbi:hypothetical protein ACTFIW_003035 [Dictyostelium discoideum]
MKIKNNTTNSKQYKCLQKISEIVDKTQLKKKQFKYVININHEADDKLKKDLEKSLDKKDVLIKNLASQGEATNNCVIQFKKKKNSTKSIQSITTKDATEYSASEFATTTKATSTHIVSTTEPSTTLTSIALTEATREHIDHYSTSFIPIKY